MEKPIAARPGSAGRASTPTSSRAISARGCSSARSSPPPRSTPDAPEEDHCGACRRCLDVCPTNAFIAPYQLDARACISYLTIEHKGHIAPRFRAAMGNRIFGCDDCLAVCPWNKFAQAARETKLAVQGREATIPPLTELLRLDDAAFRARFRGTPIKRTGRDRFLRNVLIAAGNSGDVTLVPLVEARLDDASPLVRAMAVWALSRLAPRRASRRLRAECAARSGSRGEGRVDGSGGVNRLFCFGLGFSAQTLAERLAAKGWQIAGTARDVGNIGHLAGTAMRSPRYSGEAGNSALSQALLRHHASAAFDPAGAGRRSGARALPRADRDPRHPATGSAISRPSASMATRKARWVDETTPPQT